MPIFDKAFFIRMNKKSLIFTISSLIIFSVLTGVSVQAVKTEEMDLFEQQKLTSHLLINLFLEKLDQNELLIFGRNISRTDLQSHQVSYVYNMADDTLFVRLCFTLQKKILVPNFEQFYVEKIVVETDKDGNIIQVKTNVSPLNAEHPQ